MGKQKKRKAPAEGVSKRDKRHLVEFGESHPANEEATDTGRTVVVHDHPDASPVDSESDMNTDSENETDAVTELLSTFSHAANEKSKRAIETESESESSIDDEGGESEQDQCEREDPGEVDGTHDSTHEGLQKESGDELDLLDAGTEKDLPQTDDPFLVHFEWDLDCDSFPLDGAAHVKTVLQWPALGNLRVISLADNKRDVALQRCTRLSQLHIRPSIVAPTLTPLQLEIMSVLITYRDFLHSERTLEKGEEIRQAYCLHALNHMLKTRSRILHHNAKLHKGAASEFRDQGLTRPKVLIVVPFRESALRIVNLLAQLLGAKDVVNKGRFHKEFEEPEENKDRKKMERPADYEATFAGNTDDSFRIGIRLAGKTLRLYSEFYFSDIIVASPLGLRTVIGAEGEKGRDFDFLSSVEVVVIDQAEVFLMQNWDHLLHLLAHINKQPGEAHGADFSRARLWCVQGWGNRFRQTAVFSSVAQAPINALLSRHAQSYAGSVAVVNSVAVGHISSVAVVLPQLYRRFECGSSVDAPDARFQFFVEKVLPQLTAGDAEGSHHVLVYVKTYFDFVRLRNHLRREGHSFTQTCEYTTNEKVARARNIFFRGYRRMLLYTERFHFYRRYRIKGVRHLVFYELPTYPHFYPELCNLLHPTLQRRAAPDATFQCTVLFCKQDALQLGAVLGTERAAKLLYSQQSTHMFVSGD
ncbi:U3 small nucleolar RNA-associated protein 25 homolog [Ornithodoros turicata]|uniref:U3 small nucleolar RNA-associated protein 25 homolog n=1 Tax=Ornithodoros turicata TaxID=34597 RepID=UPI003139437F